MSDKSIADKIHDIFNEGIALKKCRQCGCMKDSLDELNNMNKDSFPAELSKLILEAQNWQEEMLPIKYSCLGCDYCYPAESSNLLVKTYPEFGANLKSDCSFETHTETWPPVPGEYFVSCVGNSCPVAVSTLASTELAQQLANKNHEALCIVGKTETENIGVDKLVKNIISNPSIKTLLLTGEEPKKHRSGETLLCLSQNGVDEKSRVIGSTAVRPVLKNVTKDEIETFRNQVKVVDMIGCLDIDTILEEITNLGVDQKTSCACESCDEQKVQLSRETVPVIRAKPIKKIKLDKAGYFVILPIIKDVLLRVEHYSYDNKLLRIIEGKTSKEIYLTIINESWIKQLDHAAYLGKELARAELSLRHDITFVQDGA
jgi:tetrahydromethanopterin S-methyltransferase subunit A